MFKTHGESLPPPPQQRRSRLSDGEENEKGKEDSGYFSVSASGSRAAMEACPTQPSQYGTVYRTARDCASPLSAALSLASSSFSSETPPLLGRIWDVSVPNLQERIFGGRHPQPHTSTTPLPAFAFITSSRAAKHDFMYQTTGFAHAQCVTVESQSTSSPDVEMLRLGSQILSIYFVVTDSFDFDYQDQQVSSLVVCLRRMGYYHEGVDADSSNSSYSFRPPPSFTCVPLHQQITQEITNQLRQKTACDFWSSHTPPPPLSPLQLCKVVVKYDVLVPSQTLPPLPPATTFEFFSYAEIELQFPDSRLHVVTPSPPLYFDFVPRSARLNISSIYPPSLFAASSISSLPPPSTLLSSTPRVHIPSADANHAYILDSVFIKWAPESCNGDGTLIEAFDGQRACSYSGTGSRARSLWMIFKTSGDVWTGLGMSSITTDGHADIMVFDCAATVTQRAWDGNLHRHTAGREWSFYPWCLPLSTSDPSLLRSSFFPTPTLNTDYLHLESEISLREVLETVDSALLLQRTRGVLSLTTAAAFLNGSHWISNSSTNVVLDCGCCGWTSLISMAEKRVLQSSIRELTSPFEPQTVIARLPLFSSSSTQETSESRWLCQNVSNFDSHEQHHRDLWIKEKRLGRVLSLIRKAFKIVSWDRLSAEEIRVTFIPRIDMPINELDESATAAKMPVATNVEASQALPCALGVIDVCNLAGCSSSDKAEDCVAPKLLEYFKTVMKMCILRRTSAELFDQQQSAHYKPADTGTAARPICSGLHKLGETFVMKVADDAALVAIASYAAKHDAFNVHDQKSKSRGAFVADIRNGGIGNVFQILLGAALIAISDDRQLLITLSPQMQNRYGGHFTSVVDAFADGNSVGTLFGELLGSEWHISNVLESLDSQKDYLRCVWGFNETLHLGAITRWVNGRPPFTLLMNERFGHRIKNVFGVDSDFYLSHFLVSPVAEIRQRASDSMSVIRSKFKVVIGVHMRWVAEGLQYLLPEDMDWFLFCAVKLATWSSSSSIAFYVASDSTKHVGLFARGIAAAASSSAGAIDVERNWAVFTAEIVNNATDSWTSDSFADVMMLSLCDHLIGTEFSTFTTLAAALGAHRPVIVGARAAQRFGRNKLIRVSRFSPVRTDFGDGPPTWKPCMRDVLSCESHAVDDTFFVPMFLSEIGFMNASLHWAVDYATIEQQHLADATESFVDKCQPNLFIEEIKEARRWYENLYDVF